jgi:hypothetical protein
MHPKQAMVDLGELITLTKLEVAEHQLDLAVELFLDRRDYVASITLAGASEEILGKLLEACGESHVLGEYIESCVKTGKHIFKEDWPAKDFAELANYFRNGLKHITNGAPITLSREAAAEIIERAIANLWKLEGKESPRVRRFMEEVYGT